MIIRKILSELFSYPKNMQYLVTRTLLFKISKLNTFEQSHHCCQTFWSFSMNQIGQTAELFDNQLQAGDL